MAPFSDFVSTAISEGIDYWKAPRVRSSPSTAASSTCPSHIEVVRNIFVFFALNIGAHAVTALPPPGQRWPAKLGAMLWVAVAPVTTRLWYFDTLLKMAFSQYSRRDTDPRCGSAHERLMDKIFGRPGDTGRPLQAAIDVGAVAVRYNPRFRNNMRHWKPVPLSGRLGRRDALYIDGRPVPAAEDVRIVPVGTTTTSEARVKASSSLFKSCIAVGQLVYGVIELWGSTRPEVRERGLASPFIVIIPYIWMSFVNLLINMCVDTYPYIIVLQEPDAVPESVSSQNKDADEDFDTWLANTYSLQMPFALPVLGTVMYTLVDDFVRRQAAPWFGLLACYGPVTLILYGVARMAVPAGTALVAAAFLCWMYGGVPGVALNVLLMLASAMPKKPGVAAGVLLLLMRLGVPLLMDTGSEIAITVLAEDASGSEDVGWRRWVVVVLVGMVVLMFVAPVAVGVYCAIIELWKYYNLCSD